MEIITSASGNKYIYEQRTGYLSLVPSSYMLDDANISYYSQKKKYLSRLGLIDEEHNRACNYRLLEPIDVKEALNNTHQIIFEVTDKCNLDCYYCGYGHLYDNYDARENQDMSFDVFKTLYDYLKDIWENTPIKGCTFLRISFYGGEPLCNFPLIKEAVDYVKDNPIKNKRIIFSMTTNAVLLDKYIEFLVDNDFEILISLDGNKHNNSYRVFKNGKCSFDTVIANVDKVYSSYPSYFLRNIKFNSVLHDRNSVKEANNYIFARYQKQPMTNELNVFGIAKSKRSDFMKIFHSKSKEFSLMSDNEKKAYQNQSPDIHRYEKWAFNTLMRTYSTSLLEALSVPYVRTKDHTDFEIPTKTCIPFSRKVFISVNGNIFPCERIGNELNFGRVFDGKVEIDIDGIVSQYNQLLRKYERLCSGCKAKDFCSVCVVSDLNGYEICKRTKPRNIDEFITFFEQKPELLRDIIKTVSII